MSEVFRSSMRITVSITLRSIKQKSKPPFGMSPSAQRRMSR
jgi:hypothetical protein